MEEEGERSEICDMTYSTLQNSFCKSESCNNDDDYFKGISADQKMTMDDVLKIISNYNYGREIEYCHSLDPGK